MIGLQLPSALSVDNRDYTRDRPRTLQNDSLLRRSILFLRMLIEEIKRATWPRCMEERKGFNPVTAYLLQENQPISFAPARAWVIGIVSPYLAIADWVRFGPQQE